MTDGVPRCVIAAVVLVSATTAAAVHAQFNEFAKLAPFDGTALDHFGSDGAMSGDVIVIGSKDHNNDGSDQGAAYVYRLIDNIWTFEQKLVASEAQDFALFGTAVGIDGDVIIIGARRYDVFPDGGGIEVLAGAAFVYRYDGETWVEEARLEASDPFKFDEFGNSVAVEGDRALIGAHGEGTACDDSEDRNILQNCHSGAVYVFDYDGATWNETAKITPRDADVRDFFGDDVALQGDIAVIGAWDEGSSAGPCPPACGGDGNGAAYVYRFDGNDWIEEVKLLPPDVEPFAYFGIAVDIQGDRILIGSEGDAELAISGGAAFVYRHDPKGPDPWVLEQKLNFPDTQFADFWGHSVGLQGDIALVGSHYRQVNGEDDAGMTAVWRYNGIKWIYEADLAASDAEECAFFAFHIFYENDRAVVCSIADHVDGIEDVGSAYVFTGLDDCNGNDRLDFIDIALDGSPDVNGNGIPDECEGGDCPADLDGDGVVGSTDLITLLGAWGDNPGHPADFDGDDLVGTSDLIQLLGSWGPCE